VTLFICLVGAQNFNDNYLVILSPSTNVEWNPYGTRCGSSTILSNTISIASIIQNADLSTFLS